LNDSILFIADTHFRFDGSTPDERDKRLSFIEFLERSDAPRRLYLLGDIFDFWFEYRSVIPRYYRDIIEALAGLKGRGTEILLTGGNHDFWYGSYFAETLGFTLLPQLAVHELQGKRVVVTHGDALLPRDFGYKALKAVIRSRPAVACARAVHPDILFGFAASFSRFSKGLTEPQTERCARMLRSMALSSFFRWDNEIFIMGHVHYPCLDRFDEKAFVILGDWERHRSYGELAGGEISLKYYSPAETTFTEKR